MRQSPRLLFLTDPWDTLDHPEDSSLRLVEEAVSLGIQCWWSDVKTVRWQGHTCELDAQQVLSVNPPRNKNSFSRSPPAPARPSDFPVVLYRPDPPVDLAYLHPLQLIAYDLELRAEQRTTSQLVNPAHVLFMRCEKLHAVLGENLLPPTFISSQYKLLLAFGKAEGKTIVKPLHQAQSKGVELLDFTTPSAIDRSFGILASMTQDFQLPVVLQRYLPQVLEGETRLWFMDGNLLAVAQKRPNEGSYRIDMDKGATLVAHELTDLERSRVPAIQTLLRKHGIRLAAVDMIAGWVTDFNVTSPGLLTSMERIAGRNLARTVVLALARETSILSEWRGEKLELHS